MYKQQKEILLGVSVTQSCNLTTEGNIGEDAPLCYVEGVVCVECLSNSSTLVHSRDRNAHHCFHPITVEILRSYSHKIFDNERFVQLLAQSVNHRFEALSTLHKVYTI